jgi:transcription termination factor Rho
VARYLFIVARDEPDLWAHLAQEFAGEGEVEVRLDRRRHERRQATVAVAADRRRSDRRRRPTITRELQTLNFALVASD